MMSCIVIKGNFIPRKPTFLKDKMLEQTIWYKLDYSQMEK